MDELRLERRERDGHGRGHGRLEGRHRDHQGHGGRQVGVRHGDRLRPAGSVQGAGRVGEGPRVRSGGRHVCGVDLPVVRPRPGCCRRVQVRRRERAAVERGQGQEPAVDRVPRPGRLRDVEERELGPGAGRGGSIGQGRRERAAVERGQGPQPEVDRGQGRRLVPSGVRAFQVAGPGRVWRVQVRRRERAAVERGQGREPEVDVQGRVPEVRDGVVPSVLRAVARARAVARVRQSGLHRRHGDDEGLRRLVEGHGALRGLREDRPVVLVRLHVR